MANLIVGMLIGGAIIWVWKKSIWGVIDNIHAKYESWRDK